MTRASPRPNFNSSNLLRFLAGLSIADLPESRQSFAERLGEWVDFTDAITLLAALGPPAGAAAPMPRGELDGALAAAEADCERIRSTLVNSIVRSCTSVGGAGRDAAKAAQVKGDLAAGGSAALLRIHQALQREMDGALRPLREAVRATLARAGPGMQRLAALDAALDKVLWVRERNLLATLPAMLEKRYEQLRAAQAQAAGGGDRPDRPDACLQPAIAEARFRDELQRALLAELDLRLQPVLGLMDALRNEAARQ